MGARLLCDSCSALPTPLPKRACRECRILYLRAYRKRNPDSKAKDRERYWANPEKKREEKRRSTARHKTKTRERVRDWHRSNRDKTRAYRRIPAVRQRRQEARNRWEKRHPDKNRVYRLISKVRRRAREAGLALLTTEVVSRADIFRRDGGLCRYCGHPVGEKWHLDHVKAIAAGGHHTRNNLVVSCQNCNLRKATRPWTPLPPVFPAPPQGSPRGQLSFPAFM